jgi:hypothetical protein
MAFWKLFNEFTVGFGYGSFAILYLIVLFKAVPDILRSFKEVTGGKK